MPWELAQLNFNTTPNQPQPDEERSNPLAEEAVIVNSNLYSSDGTTGVDSVADPSTTPVDSSESSSHENVAYELQVEEAQQKEVQGQISGHAENVNHEQQQGQDGQQVDGEQKQQNQNEATPEKTKSVEEKFQKKFGSAIG